MMRRAIGGALMSMLLGGALGLLTGFSLPLLDGARPHTIVSGSMRPALDRGDVAVVSRTPAAQVRVGEVVAFRDPHGRRRVTVHRVRGVQVGRRRVSFVTKGDASAEAERWQVEHGGTVGRVEHRVRYLGYLGLWPSGATARFAFTAVPCIVLAALLLRRIWRRPPSPSPSSSRARTAEPLSA